MESSQRLTRSRAAKLVKPPQDDNKATTTDAAMEKKRVGRPRKAVTEPLKPEPAKTTRTRAKKADNEESKTAEVPAKRATRTRVPANSATTANPPGWGTRPTPGLKSAAARPASRLGTAKKTVSFDVEEEEKENMLAPAATTKARTATKPAGMSAKPVRRVPSRTTRAATKATTDAKKAAPLSPKKDNSNVLQSQDSSSEDELAMDAPKKSFAKSPIKAPSAVKRSAEDVTSTLDESKQPEATGLMLGSPVKPAASPFKDSFKSPAKKGELPSLNFASARKGDVSPLAKSTMSSLRSPAKKVAIKSLQFPAVDKSDQTRSPFKSSLLQSPAKRPISSLKIFGSPSKSSEKKVQQFGEVEAAPAAQEQPLAQAAESEAAESSEGTTDELAMSEEASEELDEEPMLPSPQAFPGRLSAVLPRHADPALQKDLYPIQKPIVEQTGTFVEEEMVNESAEPDNFDPMDIDEVVDEVASCITVLTQPLNPSFALRASELDATYDSDSEDELAPSGGLACRYKDESDLSLNAMPATPTPSTFRTPKSGLSLSAIKASRAIASVSKNSKLGFTPLARQLNEWRATSPLKLGSAEPVAYSGPADSEEDASDASFIEPVASPAKPSLFEEEMRIRADMENEAAMEAALEADIAARYEEPVFDDVVVTSEDVELAEEANEMSLLDPEQVGHMLEVPAHEDAMSEASQEYGDENAIPIDPALMGPAANQSNAPAAPFTPVRAPAMRTFHTVSKVPLKAADDSPPRSAKRRSASVSRLPTKRPTGLSRNATVISYSPTKSSARAGDMETEQHEEQENAPVTPAKSEAWSSMGTPARTPRRDLNTDLLRGAVVFVDVHTSEGADASTLFVELLTQMGARCVKSWPWNPSSPTNGDASTSKIGITHVVYKDGGKRTMEKVRESGGVVQCVGVGWVLDCERENEWLDEAPYYIDTSLVPRGGARRRKSMEPKALANLNGMLVTPVKNNGGHPRECQTVPNNHMSRRDSTVWVKTPSDRDEDEEGDDNEWDGSMLTPLPKTPAPEAVARFAMGITQTPQTPAADASDLSTPQTEQLLMRTCPPKQSVYADLGQGFLSPEKDQSVMMRLMAARRKSLQFAPKVASPLSKAWN